jgi:hypothetical protein
MNSLLFYNVELHANVELCGAATSNAPLFIPYDKHFFFNLKHMLIYTYFNNLQKLRKL